MIRRYRTADLDAVLGVFHRSVHALAASDYTPAQRAAWAPDVPDRNAWSERLASGHTFVDARDGPIAGFARAEDDGYIDLFFVDPAFAGRGVGSALLGHVLDRLREHGCSRTRSRVSLTARPFFERHGFVASARYTVQRAGIELDQWSMARDLDSSQTDPRTDTPAA